MSITPSLKHRIGNVTIWSPPKVSCRSVTKFCNDMRRAMTNKWHQALNVSKNIVVFRNPYHRFISGYLNKYVEHPLKYKARVNPKHDISSFQKVTGAVHKYGFKILDILHFEFQTNRYKGVQVHKIINSESLDELSDYMYALGFPKVETSCVISFKRKNVEDTYDLEEDPCSLNFNQLHKLLANGRIPTYGRFYNEDLKRMVYESYKPDFVFIKNCRDLGLIDERLYIKLTSVHTVE